MEEQTGWRYDQTLVAPPAPTEEDFVDAIGCYFLHKADIASTMRSVTGPCCCARWWVHTGGRVH